MTKKRITTQPVRGNDKGDAGMAFLLKIKNINAFIFLSVGYYYMYSDEPEISC